MFTTAAWIGEGQEGTGRARTTIGYGGGSWLKVEGLPGEPRPPCARPLLAREFVERLCDWQPCLKLLGFRVQQAYGFGFRLQEAEGLGFRV